MQDKLGYKGGTKRPRSASIRHSPITARAGPSGSSSREPRHTPAASPTIQPPQVVLQSPGGCATDLRLPRGRRLGQQAGKEGREGRAEELQYLVSKDMITCPPLRQRRATPPIGHGKPRRRQHHRSCRPKIALRRQLPRTLPTLPPRLPTPPSRRDGTHSRPPSRSAGRSYPPPHPSRRGARVPCHRPSLQNQSVARRTDSGPADSAPDCTVYWNFVPFGAQGEFSR